MRKIKSFLDIVFEAYLYQWNIIYIFNVLYLKKKAFFSFCWPHVRLFKAELNYYLS